jgi:hypothetical protein
LLCPQAEKSAFVGTKKNHKKQRLLRRKEREKHKILSLNLRRKRGK